jgi:hypothetical protein
MGIAHSIVHSGRSRLEGAWRNYRMLSFRMFGAALGLVSLWACGGAGFSSLQNTTGDGGASDASDDGAQGTNDAASSSDGSSGGKDASTGMTQDAASSADASGAPCPDVRGAYTIVLVEALGCGDLDPTAPQCIRQGQSVCGILFRTSGTNGSVGAIDGAAVIGAKGNFAGASLTEGSVDRSGCTGSWNAGSSTMTVDCGGTGSSQSCVVALQRTGSVCN